PSHPHLTLFPYTTLFRSLKDLTIEISALDPPFRVADTSRISIGTHGLAVTQGRRRGLLLPQVALDQGWDLRTFLEETCLKAGLRSEEHTSELQSRVDLVC